MSTTPRPVPAIALSLTDDQCDAAIESSALLGLANLSPDAREDLRGLCRQAAAMARPALLAADHTSMRVDYSGLLKQARAALRREPGLAEMLRQLQEHLEELGQRWYAGDTAVVDEILQLYCIEREARAAVKAKEVGRA